MEMGGTKSRGVVNGRGGASDEAHRGVELGEWAGLGEKDPVNVGRRGKAEEVFYNLSYGGGGVSFFFN